MSEFTRKKDKRKKAVRSVLNGGGLKKKKKFKIVKPLLLLHCKSAMGKITLTEKKKKTNTT